MTKTKAYLTKFFFLRKEPCYEGQSGLSLKGPLNHNI